DRLLPRRAEAGRVVRVAGVDVRATRPLEAVAAQEPRLLVLEVAEARDVEAPGPAVVEGARLAHEVLDEAHDPGAHHVLAEVVADVAARVAEAGRMGRALREGGGEAA